MFKGLKTLIAGILAGATLGILFSPKGDEVRKNIKDEMDEGGSGINAVKNTAVEFGKNLSGTLADSYEELKASDSFKEGSQKVKKEAEKLLKEHTTATQRRKAKSAIKKAKNAINKAAERINKKK